MTTGKKVAITLAMREGQLTFSAPGEKDIILRVDSLSPEVRAHGLLHGMAARLRDMAALEKGATAGEKMAEIRRGAEYYATGATEWGMGRAAGGGGGQAALVILALARVYNESTEKAEATVVRTMEKKKLDRKAALALWAGTDKVAAAIADIQAERAAARAKVATVDADDLLAEMGDD